MIKSKKFWEDAKQKSKDEKLEPLEVIPLSEQNKEGEQLDKESEWIIIKQKITNGGKSNE